MDVPAEAAMAETCMAFERQQRLGVNEAAIRHILRKRTGQLIVLGAAQHFKPDEAFTRADLAQAIGKDEASVFSWIRQLGRSEKKFRMRVFNRAKGGKYSLTPQMHEAILRLVSTPKPI
jgi:hypothetical protein